MITDPPIDAFKIRATHGWLWQLWLEEQLRAKGINTSVPPLQIRPYYAARKDFADEYDLLAGDDLDVHIEVKSRSTPVFKSLDEFPYDAVFIEPLAKWKKREKKPDWYVVISQPSAFAVAVNTDTADEWVEERGRGGERVISAGKDLFVNLDYMCEMISPASIS